MTRRVDRVLFALILLYAGLGAVSASPEIVPGSRWWTVLDALVHVIAGLWLMCWAAWELVAGLRATWRAWRE